MDRDPYLRPGSIESAAESTPEQNNTIFYNAANHLEVRGYKVTYDNGKTTAYRSEMLRERCTNLEASVIDEDWDTVSVEFVGQRPNQDRQDPRETLPAEVTFAFKHFIVYGRGKIRADVIKIIHIKQGIDNQGDVTTEIEVVEGDPVIEREVTEPVIPERFKYEDVARYLYGEVEKDSAGEDLKAQTGFNKLSVAEAEKLLAIAKRV